MPPGFHPVKAGRGISLLLALCIPLFVFDWARRLYGARAGWAALILYSFCPNLLAYHSLVTTDVYSTLGFVSTIYFFWRALLSGSLAHAAASGLCLGLALAGKHSSSLLIPILLLIAAIRWMLRSLTAPELPLRRQLGWAVRGAAAVVLPALLAVNACYLFGDLNGPLASRQYDSAFFRNFVNNHRLLAALPLPIPAEFIHGLDQTKWTAETGFSYGNVYLFGKAERGGKGFPNYFLWALLYKVPLGAQLLLLFTLLLFAWELTARCSPRASPHLAHARYPFANGELFLLAPLLFCLYFFNREVGAQIGMRYLLMIFPFAFILIARLAEPARWRRLAAPGRALCLLLASWAVISALSWFPHFIPYFNELLADRKLAYQILSDSNLDWGQGEHYLEQYLREHPGVILSPPRPTAGRIIVPAIDLTGVTTPPAHYAWLRDNFLPVDHLVYAYLIFDISEADLRRILGEAAALRRHEHDRFGH